VKTSAVRIRKSITPNFSIFLERRQTIQVFTTSPDRAWPDAGAMPREMELAV
jgi:hypothetical protein